MQPHQNQTCSATLPREFHGLKAPFATEARPIVVTMTLARTAAESRALLRSVSALAETGCTVHVGEGGSLSSFVDALRRLPNLVVHTPSQSDGAGLVQQLRPAFAQALESGGEYLLYTEPDKLSFFRSGLDKLAARSQRATGRGTGIVLASRSRRALATFPTGQRRAEALMNQICGEAFGIEGDYTYGPMLIHRSVARHLALAPADLGWGWRFFLMAIARQLRMRLELCPVSQGCPAAQRAEDDERARAYRLKQLEQNVTGLANGWTWLLDAPAVPLAPLLTARY